MQNRHRVYQPCATRTADETVLCSRDPVVASARVVDCSRFAQPNTEVDEEAARWRRR